MEKNNFEGVVVEVGDAGDDFMIDDRKLLLLVSIFEEEFELLLEGE